MTAIEILDDVTVTYIDHMGSDNSIIRAARVSVVGENEISEEERGEIQKQKDTGLINYLMRKKHGSPFEHNAVTFYVKAPIFVFREFHRHRIASYNEMSGRYTKLLPEFYAPKESRPLVNVGSSANPKFEPGNYQQVKMLAGDTKRVYQEAWDSYERLLEAGIGNEVARVVLPVGIMSQMYATMNLRAWLNFLSLRTFDERATFPSNPQHEIEMVARKIETELEKLFPDALASFNKNGRVAP